MPFDPKQLLDLLPLALGSLHPGSPEHGAFMQGYLHSMQQIEQSKRLKANDQSEQQYRQAEMSNLQADNQRQDQQLALQRLTAYGTQDQRFTQELQQSPETRLPPDTDPLQAQNALTVSRLGTQQQFGVPAGTPQGPLPNMTQLVSEGKKRRARALIDRFDKEYGDQAKDAEGSVSPHQGEFAGQTFAQIRQLAGNDIPPAPAGPKTRPPAAAGSFEDYLPRFAAERGKNVDSLTTADIEDARRRYQQADDPAKRPPTPPRDRWSIQPITQKDGTVSLVRVNLETGESSPVALPSNAAGAGRPNAGEQTGAGYLLRTQASDVTAKSFESQLSSLGDQLDVQLPNLMKTEQGQKYRQAQDEFINASLRRESGAAIQPSEYVRFAKIYFVQPGDRPATIAQKQVARQRVIDGFKVGAGNLGKSDILQSPAPSGDMDSALSILNQRRQQRTP